MISINPVFQVLVLSGANALATAGKRIDELVPGQLGIFDYETNLTVTAANAKITKRIYLAVGISTTGSTVAPSDDRQKSAAEYIKFAGITNTVLKAYIAGVDQVDTITIAADSLLPDTSYGVRFSVQNSEAYANYGVNLPTKYFGAVTGPETDPATGTADTEAYIDALVANINADDEKLIVAAKTSPTTLTVTMKALGLKQAFSGVNLNYLATRGTKVITSLIDFDGQGTIANTTALVMEQGSGYDIVEREYEAGGWNGNPGVYRASDTTYLNGGVHRADPAKKYATLSVSYVNDGIGGGQVYNKSLLTEIVAPNDVATALTALENLSVGLGGNTYA